MKWVRCTWISSLYRDRGWKIPSVLSILPSVGVVVVVCCLTQGMPHDDQQIFNPKFHQITHNTKEHQHNSHRVQSNSHCKRNSNGRDSAVAISYHVSRLVQLVFFARFDVIWFIWLLLELNLDRSSRHLEKKNPKIKIMRLSCDTRWLSVIDTRVYPLPIGLGGLVDSYSLGVG